MNSRKDDKWNLQIYEEACDWLIAFRTGTPDLQAREALDEWLRRSPEHVRAYLEVSTLWEDTALHDQERKVDVAELIARAIADDNVVEFETRAPPVPARRFVRLTTDYFFPKRARGVTSHPARHSRLTTAAAALILGTAIVTGWFYSQRDSYSTGVGEQRSLALDDGSVIELNARSRLQIHFTDRERTVDLVQGQALFTVAKDPSRPFIVQSQGLTVRAVGTEFDVYRRNSGTTVTVLEGTVAVRPNPQPQKGRGGGRPGVRPPGSENVMLVAAAKQITITENGLATPIHSANLDATTAWTRRRLVFDSTPLAEVVEEFNRYNRRPLVISDPALAGLTVVGVFSSTDPGSLVRFLESQPGIQVVESASEIRVSSHQPPGPPPER